MAKNWEKIAASAPLNATASRVVSKGYKYEPEKKITNAHWDIRPAQFNPKCALTGKFFGRLTVVGIYLGPEQSNRRASYLCRCTCGAYELRRSRAINNPKNINDACQKCLHLEFLKNKAEIMKKREGENSEESKIPKGTKEEWTLKHKTNYCA